MNFVVSNFGGECPSESHWKVKNFVNVDCEYVCNVKSADSYKKLPIILP